MAVAYAEWLSGPGRTRGLMGPREVPRLWERHLLNCAVVSELVPPKARVCDLGSGAGLPGLALAIRRPDLHVTLVEPLLRRTRFLSEVVADLDLPQVEVLRARAEELRGKDTFDVVTSRAVAPLERLLTWSLPLLRARGLVLAMKGEAAADEVRRATPGLNGLGGGRPEVVHVGESLLSFPTTVVRVEATDPRKLTWAPKRGVARPRSGRGGSRRR
jgi:16S rRNA (guanine527-N7)-methyltransferase